jgi:cytochrome c oxidase subunit II
VETLRQFLPAFFQYLPLYPEQASTMAAPVDFLYLVWVALSFVVSVLIVGFTVYFGVRYRRRRVGDTGEADFEAPIVEMLSMGVPFVIAMAMFAWGTKVYVDLRRPPEDALEYFAFGKQWMWKYQHPNGLREINDLTVPVDTPIKMTLASEDVLHAFFVPAFRIKQDVVPGRYNVVWFEATKTGQFRILCAEYCGTDHSKMGGMVTVLEKEEYEAWLRGEQQPQTSPAAAGEDLFTSLACATCHGAEDTERGPSLHGLFGSDVRLASGATVRVDDQYLRESIVDPAQKLRSGFRPLMPTFAGQVSEEQVATLVHYIKNLGPAPEETATESETLGEVLAAGG